MKKPTMNQNTAGAIFTSFAERLFCLSSFCVLCQLLTVSGLSIRSTQYLYYANCKKKKQTSLRQIVFMGILCITLKERNIKRFVQNCQRILLVDLVICFTLLTMKLDYCNIQGLHDQS